ncbi:MAG: RagB/SusD family nutrient uptake outer membrane protein [Bacteroidales bacterium]|nr:RagB/SusD family nutrient uptake outer membrane protein [Bacteroidales bacterium]
MKKLLYVLPLALTLCSCSDFLDVDSNSVMDAESYKINTEDEARYAMFGVLQQLQKVADRYVVLGELRADLLTTTDNASQDLRDIVMFEATGENEYQVESDLYAVINNCNYLLSRIDTTVLATNSSGERIKVLKYEMAQAVAIRAWSYLQLALTYGEVSYYTTPILDVDDSKSVEDAETLSLDGLLPVLTADLQAWVPDNSEEVEIFPNYGTIGDYSASQLFLPVRVLLGDLYLLQNQYEKAAELYYAHLLSNKLLVLNYRNGWSDNTFTRVSTKNWTRLFSTSSEMQSLIQGSEEYIAGLQHLQEMFDASDDYLLAPASNAIALFDNQTYAYSATVTTPGDLRGEYGTYAYANKAVGDADLQVPYVSKYKNLSQTVILYRTSDVYLHYAEAINRLGKHNMAFAFLKYGLNADVLTTNAYCPASEWQDADGNVVPYLDFGQSNLNYATIFADNVGMHSRGCGAGLNLYRSYAIESGVDSLLFVEGLLLDEMALETAFEGNRFADILRISHHRNDPSFVASTIAAKYGSAKAAMLAKLEDAKNWYLPHQENE